MFCRLFVSLLVQTPLIYDYGEQWSKGIITLDPPRLLTSIVSPVPAMDQFGNELGDVRPPLLKEPIVNFLPWVLRHNAEFSKYEMMVFRGSIKVLPAQDILKRHEN
jgi:hypothetical protein